MQKVLEVETRLKAQGTPPDVVIGADTMVTLDGTMFGKPTSEEEAFDMLKRLLFVSYWLIGLICSTFGYCSSGPSILLLGYLSINLVSP